jgi:hypothetical protein
MIALAALVTPETALKFATALMELQTARLKAASPVDAAAMMAREQRWAAIGDKIMADVFPGFTLPAAPAAVES